MHRKIKILSKASLVALILTFMVVGVAFALVITMDGDDDGDWGTNPTTCTIGAPDCARIIDDPQDVTNPAAAYYDIRDVFQTNDSTYFYFRVDYYGNGTDLANSWYPTSGGTTPFLNICLDIDNNTSTGQTLGSGLCDGDETVPGVDYRIAIVPDLGDLGQPQNPVVHTCTNSFCANPTGTGLVSYDSYPAAAGDSDTITEIRVLLSDLGITGSTCPSGFPQPCIYRVGLYYDNGVSSSDDSVPDNGTRAAQFGNNSPTALTLASLTARSGNVYAVPLLVGSLLLLAALLLVVRRVRRRVS